MRGTNLGALAIALWAIAILGGVFFPPLFIVPIYVTYLWYKQRTPRKLQDVAAAPNQAVLDERINLTKWAIYGLLALVGVFVIVAMVSDNPSQRRETFCKARPQVEYANCITVAEMIDAFVSSNDKPKYAKAYYISLSLAEKNMGVDAQTIREYEAIAR